MKEKINEVEKYFKDKLLNKEFEIKEISEYVLRILVDGEYQFNLWLGNWDIPDNTKCYDGYYNFMMLDFTKEESILLKSKVRPEIMDYKRNVLIAQKRAELDKLEKEIA